MINKYKIVPAEEVENHIRKGWHLLGNPVYNTDDKKFYQAMTKYQTKELK